MITLLALLFAAPSPASEYIRFSEAKKEMRAAFELQHQATIPLHMVNGLRCSAVYVGPKGEALTNLHCLENCLVSQNAFTETQADGFSLRHPKTGTSCDVKFGAKLTEGKAELLHAFGPGWISPREKLPELIERFPEEMARLMSEGYEAAGDLALIRLSAPGLCVRLGQSLEGTLTNIAFPLIARKKSGNPMDPIFLTMGTTQLWSQGEATIDPAALLGKSPQFAQHLPFVLPAGTMISEVDTEAGSSGSPLFAPDGSLVGLIRATWKGETGAYVPWTSQAVNLLEKKDRIQRLVPENKDCR
jgi:hypothetical protein